MKNNNWTNLVLSGLFLCLIGLVGGSSVAFAQDGDDGGWLGGDEEEETADPVQTEGTDNPEIYRAASKEYRLSDPEEEILLW